MLASVTNQPWCRITLSTIDICQWKSYAFKSPILVASIDNSLNVCSNVEVKAKCQTLALNFSENDSRTVVSLNQRGRDNWFQYSNNPHLLRYTDTLCLYQPAGGIATQCRCVSLCVGEHGGASTVSAGTTMILSYMRGMSCTTTPHLALITPKQIEQTDRERAGKVRAFTSQHLELQHSGNVLKLPRFSRNPGCRILPTGISEKPGNFGKCTDILAPYFSVRPIIQHYTNQPEIQTDTVANRQTDTYILDTTNTDMYVAYCR